MSVIVKATIAEYLYALGFARHSSRYKSKDGERVRQIDTALAPTDAYAVAVDQAFWNANPHCNPLNQREHIVALAKFYDEICHVRLVRDSGMPKCIQPTAAGGYLVLNGELMGLWSAVRGRGNWLLDHEIKYQGARCLSCLDIPHLVQLFTNKGFFEVGREPNTNGPDEPEVIWMERNET